MQARRYLLLLHLLPFACTGDFDSANRADAGHGDDGAARESYDCVVTHSRPGTFPIMSRRWRVTWNEQTRVKAQLASEDPDSGVRLAWRYHTDGRLLANAGFGPGRYDNFQHNRAYDEHDHVVEIYSSSPPHPDLEVPPPTEADMGSTYANEYSAKGELVASTVTARGQADRDPIRYTFRHDAEGRCEYIAITGGAVESSETLSYDDAGRLLTSELEYNRPIGTNMSCPDRITTHAYDPKGRITRSTTRCRATPKLDALRIEHSYESDGSETIETFDYTDDVVNDSVTIDGVEYRFAHSKEQRTAGCAQIDAEIAGGADKRCRTR